MGRVGIKYGPRRSMMHRMSDPGGDREQFEQTLTTALAGIGLPVDEAQRDLLWRHLQLVVEANRSFNLTRITTASEAAVKHDADSLALLSSPFVPEGGDPRVLDVGTGAGFPAVPLAICRPAWRITAIDGTGKKVAFVARSAEALNLSNLVTRHARALGLAREMPSTFDLVLLRAVTQIGPGLREVLPLAAPGGRVVFYKTPGISTEELRDAKVTSRSCHLADPQTWDVQILGLAGETLHRRLICYTR